MQDFPKSDGRRVFVDGKQMLSYNDGIYAKGSDFMSVRMATLQDVPRILEIYADAREYMRQNGNPSQWRNTHPAEEILRCDIAKGQLYLCAEQEEIAGVFAYIPGIDPTYVRICGGQWLNDDPYGTIHRIAVTAHRKGVASSCFDWSLAQCPNLRIDSRRDNIPMQRSLQKNGFQYCGIIYLQSGDERLAFHKVL